MTRSTPGREAIFSMSMPAALPSAPKMVVSTPREIITLTPPSSMVWMARSSSSLVKLGFIMTTITFSPLQKKTGGPEWAADL